MKKMVKYMETATELRIKYQDNHTPLFATNLRTKEEQNKWLNDPWPWENQERRV
jgi:hypothetical protein